MPLEAATPPVNIYEGNGQLSVVIPIPGAHPSHIDVSVSANKLRLDAKCKYLQEDQHYHRRDWQVGSWRTELDLPGRIDPMRSRATLNLGVLVVMAPLSEAGTGEHHPVVE
jgi:HSP20 family molecular chaperone IbpA